MQSLAVSLAALYLRGAPRPVELRRASWPEVLKALRRTGSELGAASAALRESGHWAEALVLDSPGVLAWAEAKVNLGRVLSASDAAYPSRWLRVLGSAAPPVLWRAGEISSWPSISLVGSRIISQAVSRYCYQVGRQAVRIGFSLVSGRAEGCDRSGAAGARSLSENVVELLPHGIKLIRPPESGCYLSVCAPNEPFSTAAAMERNALIYAASSHTVIGHSRFKEGGTWVGALHASRSRLSTLVVRRSEEVAMRSLVALGGVWLDSPVGLGVALKARGPQRELFESAV
jgi:predicted Rossmann fold nucleotide-binding protein DprA/Smf involved in DNA uptake